MDQELSETLRVGALEVDPAGYRVRFEGRSLDLGRTEVELLAFLVANGHRVCSREALSEALGLVRGRSVDVVLTRLRRVLGRNFLRNVPGRGWIIDAEALGG